MHCHVGPIQQSPLFSPAALLIGFVFQCANLWVRCVMYASRTYKEEAGSSLWVWGQCGLHSVARQPEPHSETLSKNTPHTHTQSMHMPKQKTKPKQQGVNMLGRAGHVTANCPVITKLSLKCSQPSETLNRVAKYHKWGWSFQTVDPSIRLAHKVIIFTFSDGKSI